MRYQLRAPGQISINAKPSTVWYVTWTKAGRNHRVSARTSDAQEAKRFLADYAAAISAPPEQFDIAMMCEGYLREAPGEVHHMKAVIRLLGHLTMPSLNRAQVRMFHQSRRAEGASDSTINRQCRVLRAAIQWAYKEAWITLDKIPHIEAPKPAGPRERFLTYDEFIELYDAAVTPHMRTFMALAIWTGQRAGAILELTWDDVDFERGFIFFPPADNDTKRRAKAVAINTPLALALSVAATVPGCSHIISYGGRPVRSVKKAFGRSVTRAKLEDVRIHDLRRTAASWIIQNGGSMDDAAALLSDDVKTVRKHYAQFDERYLKSLTERIAR